MNDHLLYSRRDAAHALHLSEASIDVLIRRGLLKAVRKGRRVMIHRDEIARASERDLPAIWPPKVNGKTVRQAETT